MNVGNAENRRGSHGHADRNFLASPESVRVDMLKVSEVSDLGCPIRHPKIQMEKCFMKLTLLEGSRTIVIGVLGCGEICSYDVAGLPAGEHAKIAHFNHAWRFLWWNDEWHGNWTGNYSTHEAALDGLRGELLTHAQM